MWRCLQCANYVCDELRPVILVERYVRALVAEGRKLEIVYVSIGRVESCRIRAKWGAKAIYLIERAARPTYKPSLRPTYLATDATGAAPSSRFWDYRLIRRMRRVLCKGSFSEKRCRREWIYSSQLIKEQPAARKNGLAWGNTAGLGMIRSSMRFHPTSGRSCLSLVRTSRFETFDTVAISREQTATLA